MAPRPKRTGADAPAAADAHKPKRDKASVQWPVVVTIGLLAVVAATAIGHLLQSHSTAAVGQPSPPPDAQYDKPIRSVPVLDVQAGAVDIDTIVHSQAPVVLRNTVVKHWPAVRHWEWSTLGQKLPYAHGARKQASDPVFVLRSHKVGHPDQLLLAGESNATVATVNGTVEDLLSDRSAFWYHTSNLLEDWAPDALKDLDPTVFLSATMQNGSSNLQPHFLMWLSHAGVVSQCHYDRTQNFFIQVMGVKHMTLLPPAAWDRTLTYPALHPSYRQSQIVSLSREENNLLHSADAMSVTLMPGDVLYLPAFWFHRVEAVTDSLSLSVVTPSIEETAFSRAYWLRVPFGALTTPDQKMSGVGMYVAAVIRATFPKQTPQEFIKLLLSSRYEPYYRRYTKLDQATPIGTIYNKAACSRTIVPKCTAAHHASLPQSFVHDSSDVATEFGIAMQAIHDPAIRMTLLFDYVEELSRWAVDACNVATFLYKCFAK